MTAAKKIKTIKQMTVGEFDRIFPTEEVCKEYLVAKRWPTGVCCPRCGNAEIYALPSKPFHWQCHACAPQGYRFSLLVGTIFENTNYPLRTWFRVLHMMMTSKKGVSALQIHRTLGTGSYRTAWSMCHRIRAGLHEPNFQKLMGIVEVDETYVGGKSKNRHKSKRGRDDDGHNRGGGGGSGSGKTPVVGAVARNGALVARVIDKADTKTLDSFVRQVAKPKVSTIVTDEHSGYRMLGDEFTHKIIKHTQGQYVVGAIHTNTIEGFWSIFKRGVIGTFHKVSRKYMALYVAEFQFRYNNRSNDDIFGTAVCAL